MLGIEEILIRTILAEVKVSTKVWQGLTAEDVQECQDRKRQKAQGSDF